MLAAHLLLAFLWFGQTPKPHAAHAHSTAVKAAPAAPPGPKTQAELEHDLEAAFHAAPFSGDRLTLSVSGEDIAIAGEVHSAELKGVATREARRIAEKDGWSRIHVYNHLAVALPAQD